MKQARRIGFIPLRKNSKGIPQKNKKKLLGRPLFTWVLTEAIFSELDHVYVFTDDEDITSYISKNFAWSKKVSYVERSPDNAGDTSSTEDAILEFCKKINFDFEVFCLLQATSPLTKKTDINNALNKLQKGNLDAALTVVNTHRFTWSKEGNSLNYDIYNRPRRQDFDGLLIENGAVYCTTKAALQKSKNRLSGKIGVVTMNEETLVEIDSKSDWLVAEQLLINRLKRQKSNKPIKYLVLDVDGVFTDGNVAYDKSGELFKVFDMRDGMGLEIVRQNGVEVMIMTSEDSEIVARRMKKLNIENVFLGVKDKYSFLENILLQKKIDSNEMAYIGDDINDLSNMLRVAWSFCPSNATKSIKFYSDFVLNSTSAKGAIREACEFIIQYNLRFNDL